MNSLSFFADCGQGTTRSGDNTESKLQNISAITLTLRLLRLV
jgi:hypothetical protein